MPPKHAEGIANMVDPEQTAPPGSKSTKVSFHMPVRKTSKNYKVHVFFSSVADLSLSFPICQKKVFS